MVYRYNVCIGRYNNNLCPHLRVDHLVLALLLPCYLSCLQVTANWLLYKKYSQQLRPLICRDPTERIFITFWVSFILLILSLTRHTESSFGTHLTRKLFLSKLKVINFRFSSSSGVGDTHVTKRSSQENFYHFLELFQIVLKYFKQNQMSYLQ